MITSLDVPGCDAMSEMATLARALWYAQKGRTTFHGTTFGQTLVSPAAAGDVPSGCDEYRKCHATFIRYLA